MKKRRASYKKEFTNPKKATDVAHAFLNTVYKLHGLPTSLVTERDPVFISRFWQELMKLLGAQLNMSSAYHPQSDGQTERVNQCLENYLRSMLIDQPKKWTRWLALAQWWYNSTFHNSLKTSPFQALYGYPPPPIPLGHPPKSQIEAVDTLLRDRHRRAATQLKFNLIRAQERMKKYADLNRTANFNTQGDWVYIKLQPYRQVSIAGQRNQKLSPRFSFRDRGACDCISRLSLKVPSGFIHSPVATNILFFYAICISYAEIDEAVKWDNPVASQPTTFDLGFDSELHGINTFIISTLI